MLRILIHCHRGLHQVATMKEVFDLSHTFKPIVSSAEILQRKVGRKPKSSRCGSDRWADIVVNCAHSAYLWQLSFCLYILRLIISLAQRCALSTWRRVHLDQGWQIMTLFNLPNYSIQHKQGHLSIATFFGRRILCQGVFPIRNFSCVVSQIDILLYINLTTVKWEIFFENNMKRINFRDKNPRSISI